ncbi:hypothetical protein CMK19_02225 [Candidatus Poribacteria bacterium]|nr:hypothetical protein [Candidatus Poribacteria bacterium]
MFSLSLKFRIVLFFIIMVPALLILMLSSVGCQAKPTPNSPITVSGTDQLNQRITAIETWVNARNEYNKKESKDLEIQPDQVTTGLEIQLQLIQKQLTDLKNQSRLLTTLDQNITQIEKRTQALEERVNFILSKTDAGQKVRPPDWLYKTVWEKENIVYAVGTANNKKLAILNAKNKLRNYFNHQIIDQVQVLEVFNQGQELYILVAKNKTAVKEP